MRLLNAVILVLLLLLSSAQVFAQSKSDLEMSVVAEGSAAVIDNDLGRAEDEALQDAKKNAVEQGIGVFVKSESLGKDYMVIEQTILTKSEGYISSWSKIEGSRKVEKFEGNQLLTIKINAKVKLLSLVNDLSDIEEIYNSMQRPRVMVLMSENNMGVSSTDLPVSASAIMRVLQDKKFDVVDPEVVKKLIQNNSARTAIESGDTKAAALLALEEGAEILVLGSAKSSEIKLSEEMGGNDVKSSSALLNARIVYADTGDVLYTAKQTEGRGTSFSTAEEAGSKALDNAGNQLISADTQRFASQVIARWASEIQNGRTFKLVAKNITFKEMTSIKKALREMRGFAGFLGREKFTGKTASLEVKFKTDPDTFREKLDGKKIDGKKVEIQRISGNVTEFILAK